MKKTPALKSYASMKMASGAMGIPIEELRWAKSQGCEAFRYNRVVVAPLIKWRNEHPFGMAADEVGGDSLNGLKKKLMLQQMERQQFDLSKARGDYISRSELEFIIPKCLAHAIAIQRKHLPVELFNMMCAETKAGFERILTEVGKSKGTHEPAEASNGV